MSQSTWHDPGWGRSSAYTRELPDDDDPPYQPTPPRRAAPPRFGQLPGRAGVVIAAGGAGLGALATVFAGSSPGILLGLFLLASTMTAVAAVRPRAVHLVIPVPALAYIAAASLAGLVDDRVAHTSKTAMVVFEAQWIASGFPAIAAATTVAIVATIGRRLWYRRYTRDF